MAKESDNLGSIKEKEKDGERMDGGAQSPETNASSNSNSSSLLTEIVMIDETKGENEKDVWKDPFSHRPKEPTK